MKNYPIRRTLSRVILLAACSSGFSIVQANPTNHAPSVSIAWPRGGESFTFPNAVKIKADAADPDGSIAHVQFFVETNLIAVVTNPPFNALWRVGVPLPLPCDYCDLNLRAVAVDDLGAKTESAPVRVRFSITQPPFSFLEIDCPRDRAVFPAPATFDFSAELLASQGEAGPVEFFVGTNLVGRVNQGGVLTATTPPASVTVSDLTEGEYKLSVSYFHSECTCNWMFRTIRVVKLGVAPPIRVQNGRIQFDIVTSFPSQPTIVEASSNLLNWSPISTITPATNTFTFTESSPATNSHRFYRVLIPPE